MIAASSISAINVHRRTALGAHQRIDFVDLVNEPRPRRSGARPKRLSILGGLHRGCRHVRMRPLAAAESRSTPATLVLLAPVAARVRISCRGKALPAATTTTAVLRRGCLLVVIRRMAGYGMRRANAAFPVRASFEQQFANGRFRAICGRCLNGSSWPVAAP
jgi:hypothetical protein